MSFIRYLIDRNSRKDFSSLFQSVGRFSILIRWKPHLLLEKRAVAFPRRYPGQEDTLDALEAVEQQGHVARRVIVARCTEKGRRERGGEAGAEMVESGWTGAALAGALEESVVAE